MDVVLGCCASGNIQLEYTVVHKILPLIAPCQDRDSQSAVVFTRIIRKGVTLITVHQSKYDSFYDNQNSGPLLIL